MSEFNEQSVVIERKRFLEGLQRWVDRAYNNAPVVTENELQQKESRDEAEITNQPKIYKRKPASEFSYHIDLEANNVVYVTNSHDYRDLVIMSLRKIGYPEQTIASAVSDILHHEYAHGIPLLGLEGVKSYYGLIFAEIKELGKMGVKAFVFSVGRIPDYLIVESALAPINPSYKDKVLAKKHGGKLNES